MNFLFFLFSGVNLSEDLIKTSDFSSDHSDFEFPLRRKPRQKTSLEEDFLDI